MIEDIKKDAEVNMAKAIEALNNACGQIRAGRPNPSMLDQIQADYFNTRTPLKQLASITITDASTISLNVWDKTAIQAIEKAIVNSNLGLSPVINGMIIHIKIPPLTQDRRNELIKVLKKEGENTKVSLRNVRRNINTSVNNLEKEKKISKDFERDYIIEIQDLTDKYIKTSDDIIAKKIEEISEV